MTLARKLDSISADASPKSNAHTRSERYERGGAFDRTVRGGKGFEISNDAFESFRRVKSIAAILKAKHAPE